MPRSGAANARNRSRHVGVRVRVHPSIKPTAATAPPARPAPKKVSRRRLVRDLMTEKVYTLTPADDLATLYDLMDFRRVRHVPIVEDRDLVGLVTTTELPRSALGKVDDLPLSAEQDLLRRSRIGEIMSTEPDTIEPDSLLEDAAQILLENKVGCLPVVEGLRLVGILTEADFVSDYLDSEGIG